MMSLTETGVEYRRLVFGTGTTETTAIWVEEPDCIEKGNYQLGQYMPHLINAYSIEGRLTEGSSIGHKMSPVR